MQYREQGMVNNNNSSSKNLVNLTHLTQLPVAEPLLTHLTLAAIPRQGAATLKAKIHILCLEQKHHTNCNSRQLLPALTTTIHITKQRPCKPTTVRTCSLECQLVMESIVVGLLPQ